MWTLPGFSASSSRRHAVRKAWRNAAARLVRSSEPEDMVGDPVGEIYLGDALQPFPGGHRVHLEDQEPALGVLDEVYAAIAGAHGSRRCRGELGEPPRAGRRLADAASRHVGDPACTATDHRG